MVTASYAVMTTDSVLSHFPGLHPLLRDGLGGRNSRHAAEYDPDADEFLLQARVRSGDYFITLATELDKLAQGLQAARSPEAPDLERIVAELLYLHKHYRLDKQ